MAVKRYNGTSWDTVAGKGEQGTSSSITTWVKTAAGGETSLTGSSDSSTTLAYTPGQEQLFINGVLQVRGSDYTASNGTSITGLAALVAGDIATVTTVNAFSVTGAVPLSTVTANGDLIVGTSSGAVGRLGIGSTGQVLKVSGGVPVWATPAGGGKVLQVVQGTYNTEVSSSSTTYVTTGLTVSITPTSATSKIYVHAIINGLTKSSGSANNASNIRLLRNATTTIITSTGINYTGVDGTNQGQGVIQYLDSPATTSATTYDVYFANRVASGTVYAQDGGSTNQSIITVWEIGA